MCKYKNLRKIVIILYTYPSYPPITTQYTVYIIYIYGMYNVSICTAYIYQALYNTIQRGAVLYNWESSFQRRRRRLLRGHYQRCVPCDIHNTRRYIYIYIIGGGQRVIIQSELTTVNVHPIEIIMQMKWAGARKGSSFLDVPATSTALTAPSI